MERVVLHLAQGLPAQGYASEVVTLSGAPPDQMVEGITLHELCKGRGLDISLARALAGLARQSGAELLHAHNTLSWLYAVMASIMARRPVVATLHGANYGGSARHRHLRRWLAGRSASVACVSRDALAAARDQDRIAPDKLRLVYNGIDLEPIREAREQRDSERVCLGLEAGDQVVISVGRLSREKDYATLLQAIALLAGQGAPVRLLLVGDGSERAGLEQRAAELGLGERVRFLGERGDVPQLLAAADAFALSSLSEGVSLAVLEAMAAGLPVAATEVGGNPEVVLPDETGLLVPPSDAPALASALADLARDPDRASRMGLAGAARVEEHFSLRAMTQAYAHLYALALA